MIDLEAEIRRVVREELARLGASVDRYSSTQLPPLTSRRTFHERCRAGLVDGARREGRAWICSREAWHASRARKAAQKTPATPANDLEAFADACIKAAGYRETR